MDSGGNALANHQRTNDDKRTASRPWRDGRKDRCKEDGDEESKASDHGGDTSLATLCSTISLRAVCMKG